MASSSSSSFRNTDRLLWVKSVDTNDDEKGKEAVVAIRDWWPALMYENYGEVMKHQREQLTETQKSVMTIAFIDQVKAGDAPKIIHVLGTFHFIPLSDKIQTQVFSHYLHQHYYPRRHERELNRVMTIVTSLLKADVPHHNHTDVDQGESEATIATTKEEVLEVNQQDSWDTVWTKMMAVGWKCRQAKSGKSRFWIKPGVNLKRQCKKGKDFFTSLDEVQAHVEKKYGWKRRDAPSTNKKRSRQDQQQQDEGDRIWGRPTKKHVVVTVLSTPDNQATKPQDPGLPQLDDSEPEGSPYHWTVLWPKLKRDGWQCVRATRYNKLHNWYYIRPKVSVETGALGEDYFLGPADVISYVKNQDGYTQDEEPTNSSPRKRSRNVTATTTTSKTTTTTTTKQRTEAPVARKTTKSTISATVPRPKTKKFMAVKKKDWWFHEEPVPAFLQVWRLLLYKLDFKFTSGMYKLPDGSHTFSSDFEMRAHLVQHGIPNVERLDIEDKTLVERWVTFCHVPVKEANSMMKLEGMQEMSSEQASFVLETALGFVRSKATGAYSRNHEHFHSLQDLRMHLRGAEYLTPPVQGRRRKHSDSTTQLELTDDQILELRLWAALAPTPLPTIISSTPATNKNKQRDDDKVAGTPNKDGQDDDDDNNNKSDEQQDTAVNAASNEAKETIMAPAATIAVECETKPPAVARSASRKTTTKSVFDFCEEDDDENDKADPMDGRRVTLTPTSHHWLTQRETL